MTTFLILTKIALAAVLRSRHFFGRLRLRTSEVPELTPAPTKLGWLRLRLQVIFDARTRLLFFACLRFSRSTPALGSEQKKSAPAPEPFEKWWLQAAPAPQHCLAVHHLDSYRRRINTEEKAKFDVAVWETELIKFLASLVNLHYTVEQFEK